MRIGVVGPSSSVDMVVSEAAKADLPLECIPLPYANYQEIVEIVPKNRSRVEAFLFTGTTPYSYALQKLQPEEPWSVLPRSVNSLILGILKAVYRGGQDIRSVSVDSYGEDVLRLAYAEIGVTGEEIAIFVYPFQVSLPEYIAGLIAFHKDNVQSGRAKLCITGIQAVYDVLLSDGFPVTKFFATSEIILQQLQKLYLMQINISKKENIHAVISIQIVFSKERSLYGKSDMQFFIYKTKAMGGIYSFSQRIGAAVEIHDNESCRIYTMQETLEKDTNSFTELTLLRDLCSMDSVMFVAIGIGLGAVPGDAKYHADLGRDRAFKTGRSGFFIVHDDHTIVGPVIDSGRKKQKILIDKELNAISHKTGIGIGWLHRLERVVRLHGLDAVTPGELASLCDASLGTINRLLVKLENAGYVRVVGKQPTQPLGRPKRLIQLVLSQHP